MDSKIKAGDKVRYIGLSGSLVGLEGEVTEISNKIAVVRVTKGNFAYRVDTVFYPDAENIKKLELNSKFKVGDFVSYDYTAAWRGGKGKITGVEAENGTFRYKVLAIEVPDGAKSAYPNGDHSIWNENDLKLHPEQEEQAEAVEHPAHYGGDTTYEVIKVAEAWGLDEDAYLFNVLKYIARAGKKSADTELQDNKKAYFYLGRKVKRLEEAASANTD